MEVQVLRGMYPALITPFTPAGEVDERALRVLVAYHREAGTDGLFLCGSLGTGPGMTAEERRRVLEVALEAARGRLRVIAHVGSANPFEAVALARHAEAVGADAVAAVPPIYFKVAWPVVRDYYARLVDACRLPVWAYNNPTLVHFEFTVDQVIELAGIGVRGFKDSGLSVFFLQQLLHAVDRSTFAVFSAVPPALFLALVDGVDGFVGGPNNVVPQFYNALYRAVRERQWDRAVALEQRSGEVFRLCGGPYNVPMWHALLQVMGVDAGVTRLPYPPVSAEVRRRAETHAPSLSAILEELDVPTRPGSFDVTG